MPLGKRGGKGWVAVLSALPFRRGRSHVIVSVTSTFVFPFVSGSSAVPTILNTENASADQTKIVLCAREFPNKTFENCGQNSHC